MKRHSASSNKPTPTPSPSLYWYDYETFGADPRRDRPVQFAGIRTDLELNVTSEPLSLFCKPADDFLPHPEACLVTGISPQQALAEGVPEAEFIARIHREFSRPNTCVVGYNNIRFDDEVTRFTLYRNFYDPYAHEWQNGNSRWDIIDMVRLTYALRPTGIQWPRHADGKPSFRLEQLTAANGIAHEDAHDAVSDVSATIALARLIRNRQPRLYDYVFNHRSKQAVAQLLNPHKPTPVLHVSAMYPAERGCIAPVAPLAVHPSNKNEVIVYDLRVDPGAFFQLNEDELRERLFTRQEELGVDRPRLPVKTIHLNKCPVVVPTNTLDAAAARRWQIDMTVVQQSLQQLLAQPQFSTKLQDLYRQPGYEPIDDPDFMLYSGGFFSNDDRARMEVVRQTKPEKLADLTLPFDDPRLPEMLFRYRARNYPETLDAEEKSRWRAFCRQRLNSAEPGTGVSFATFEERLGALRNNAEQPEQLSLLNALEDYARMLVEKCD